jgi:benzoyl-CoA reductase subunit B
MHATGEAQAPPWRGTRSKKRLASATAATTLNRGYNQRMWNDVANGAPFVFGYGPVELFNAMGLYLILPVQYGSVIAAKQMYAHYQGIIDELGYFPSLANYESLALGYCFRPEPEIAPYGGLPAPTAIVASSTQDVQVYELYARAFNSPMFFMDGPQHHAGEVPERWWLTRREWLCAANVDFNVQELRSCVRFLESTTGRYLSNRRLAQYLARADEMCRYYGKITDLAYHAAKSPVTAADFYAEVAIFETHFGEEWALEHVKEMHDEVAALVRDGTAACEDERVRLLWAGTPLWFNLGFYNRWEESHGAIFLEAMYMPRAQRMIQQPSGDLLRDALMRRYHNFHGPTPSAAVELYLAQVRDYRLDGVVLPARGGSTREARNTAKLIDAGLRHAGVPTLTLEYSPLNSVDWDDETIGTRVTAFIESIAAGR